MPANGPANELHKAASRRLTMNFPDDEAVTEEAMLMKGVQDAVAALLTLPVPSGQSPEAKFVRDLMLAVAEVVIAYGREPARTVH